MPLQSTSGAGTPRRTETETCHGLSTYFVAGVGYCVTSTLSLLWPEHRGMINKYMTPLYFGEMPIIFWLLIKGARELPEENRARQGR